MSPVRGLRELAHSQLQEFRDSLGLGPRWGDIERALHTHLPAVLAAKMLLTDIDPQPGLEPVNVFRQLTFQLQWPTLGYPTFDLDTDVVSAALLTDPGELRLDDVKLPFGAFVLQLPETPVFFSRSGSTYCALLVWQFTTDLSGVEEWVCRVFHKAESSGWLRMPTEDVGRILLIGGLTRASRLNLTGQVTKDATLLDWLKIVEAAPHTDSMVHMVRVVMNAVAYVNSLRAQQALDAGTRRGKGRRELESKRWPVPSPIVLSPELRAAAAAVLRGEAHEPLWKLKMRHIVRGHWRQQACGPKLTQRRPTWIHPYVKGPDEAELVDRTYEVKR